VTTKELRARLAVLNAERFVNLAARAAIVRELMTRKGRTA
jgi:hypothetical protein